MPRVRGRAYANAKLGVAYTLPNLPLSFTLGYRVQVITTPVKGADSDAIDLTHGLVIGAVFRW